MAIGEPGDRLEIEADQVAERALRTETIIGAAPPRIHRIGAEEGQGLASRSLRRRCDACEEEETIHRRVAPGLTSETSSDAEAKVDAIHGGQPLSREQRAYFEPRFGADFSQVRIHRGSGADAAARAVDALAYTRGRDIVFRDGQYRPDTPTGRRLLAHELAHVVQQGAAQDGGGRIQRQAAAPQTPVYPGAGMKTPGDCSWAVYVPLKAAVALTEQAAAGKRCEKGDSCPELAWKMVLFANEITARITLMMTCFRGGDKGHWIAVMNRLAALENCFLCVFGTNCDEKLLAHMRKVFLIIVKVVAVIGAIVLVILLLPLLIEAVLGLLMAIAAFAAIIGTALASMIPQAAAVLTMLLLILKTGPPGQPPGQPTDQPRPLKT